MYMVRIQGWKKINYLCINSKFWSNFPSHGLESSPSLSHSFFNLILKIKKLIAKK